MGPLWLDLESAELTSEEKELLAHPLVGGVILFSRNFHDSEQLIALNSAIRRAAKRPILIGVDQEGGRVQRFKQTFTRLSPASHYAQHPDGERMAALSGWLMAAELIAHDIDLSFAPVLDCSFFSKAIGDRAFAEQPDAVVHYSGQFMLGMREAGMATTGKHFPGHGAVNADSHHETPIDDRASVADDLSIFAQQIKAGLLDALMPAHIIYPHYDDKPASGSPYWLKQVLRQQLNFQGIVFSDDLNMKGAHVMGKACERAQQALHAGCDMLLLCNDRQGSIEIIDNLPQSTVASAARLQRRSQVTWKQLQALQLWNMRKSTLQRWQDLQEYA
ncbi:MAG: beta-N-acetylhexosaminidase [Enterovibrio sp.]